MDKPKIILLVSGKRKSGKDFICEKIKSNLGEKKCAKIRISGPLKGLYAKMHNLDSSELMTDGPYKEKYRLDMINWSDEVRERDPGYFCKAACAEAPLKEIWIVTDIRRKTDIEWFKKTYQEKIRTVRIVADLKIRQDRGWEFTKGVDDVTSECDLDDYNSWDLIVQNNNESQLRCALDELMEIFKNL